MSPRAVYKRGGGLEGFDESKLRASIEKCLSAAGLDPGLAAEIVAEVLDVLEVRGIGESVSAGELGDAVEHVLSSRWVEDSRFLEAAKLYALARIYGDAGLGWPPDPVDASLSYTAVKLLESRYLRRDPATRRFLEAPSGMFRRVAEHLAGVEEKYGGEPSRLAEEFYRLMSSRRFLPNSPTLMNAGTELGVLSACYVLPVEDSVDGIFEALKIAAKLQQAGAGVGFDFSTLRPRGDVVAKTGGVSSGPVSFMRIFDTATEVMKSGGRRRGANMGILHVWHPDIEEFIDAKCRAGALENFNISVAVYDEFMEAAEKGDDWPLINPRLCPKVLEAPLRGFKTVLEECSHAVVRMVNAAELFDRIVHCAWRTGDPGLVFIDRVNAHNPTPTLGAIHAVNPCGENPLLDWESCNLGSLNLESYVYWDSEGPHVDWQGLARDVKLAVRLLDDVIDASRHPDPRLAEANLRTRKVGLGVMGFADMLYLLGVPYDSPDAVLVADRVMEWIEYNAKLASIELARERGPFPAFEESRLAGGWLNFEPQTPLERIAGSRGFSGRVLRIVGERPRVDWGRVRRLGRRHGYRNATVTTIAPTGSISIIAGVNSGIEPFYALVYLRNTSVGRFLEANKHLLAELRRRGMLSPDLLWRLAERGGVRGVEGAPEDLQSLLPTAHDVDPEWHVRIQAAFQRWTDNAVSKTVNLRHDEPPETVWRVYMLAWRLGCKGITIYRDKSRPRQVLETGTLREALRARPRHVGMEKAIPVKLRIGKRELVAAAENYAGGCPTCDV